MTRFLPPRARILALFCALSAWSAYAQFSYGIESPEAAEDFRLGVQAYHKARYGEATLLLERALAAEPADPLALAWLGRAYFREGYEATALAAWDEALQAGGPALALESFSEYLRARRGISPDDSGDFYVVASTIPGGSGRDRRFARPSWVQAMPDGSFLVVAYGSNEVLRFDTNGLLVARLRGGLRGYDRPFSLAPLDDGGFVLAEFGANRLLVCDALGVVQSSFGAGTGRERLAGPQYLSRDSSGYVYVTDYGNARVVKYAPDGTFLLDFGLPSALWRGLRAPTGVAVLGGLVYVADSGDGSIQVFDESGNRIGPLELAPLSKPEGLVARDGRLLVADGGRILSIDPATLAVRVLHQSERRDARLTVAALDANRGLVSADFDASLLEILVEPSSVYAGWRVEVGRVDVSSFPAIQAEVLVRDRLGRPVVGLDGRNFHLTERVSSEELRTEGDRQVAYRVESMRPAAEFQLVGKESDADPLRLALLIERSSQTAAAQAELRSSVEAMAARLGAPDTALIVEASASPALTHSGLGADLVRAAARGAPASGAWRFDRALRLAVSSLAEQAGKGSIVYLSSGGVNEATLGRTALSELAALMRNNGVRLDAVILGGAPVDPALSYLVEATGGTIRSARSAEGAGPLVEELRRSRQGRYRVRWTSGVADGFGRAYLGFALEAYLFRMSGRDESGFFAPLR